jgi:hypothetical protein
MKNPIFLSLSGIALLSLTAPAQANGTQPVYPSPAESQAIEPNAGSQDIDSGPVLTSPVNSRPADSRPVSSSPSFSPGLYVGAFGGYAWNNVDSDLGGGVDFDADGGEYGAFIGVQIDTLLNQTVGRMGLGLTGALEAYYTESNADDSSGGFSLEKDHDWGISFRPGLTFLNAHSPFGMKPYGILGYRNANFEWSGGGTSGDKNFGGFELGIGSELVAYDKVGVRLDYTHVFYEDKGGIDPSENNLRLGVAYHF